MLRQAFGRSADRIAAWLAVQAPAFGPLSAVNTAHARSAAPRGLNALCIVGVTEMAALPTGMRPRGPADLVLAPC